MYDVIVIGLGASGLFALANIDKNIKVLGIDSNKIAGKKLRITGGGRCNLTQTKDVKSLVSSYTHPSFVRPILYGFNNQQLMEYFSSRGFELILEGQRVYPKTQRADSVADFLLNQVFKKGHELRFDEKVLSLDFGENQNKNHNIVVKTSKNEYITKSIIIATGGASYSKTGSDGLLISKYFTIRDFEPALCHMYLKQKYFNQLQGISTRVKIKYADKIFEDEILFAGKFCTGPVIYDLSNYIKYNDDFTIDFMIDISEGELINEIRQVIKAQPKMLVRNAFIDKFNYLLPERLIRAIFEMLNLDRCICAEFKKSDFNALIKGCKSCKLSIDKKAPIENATVTIGGIKVDDISNKTMCLKNDDRIMVIGEAIELVGNCGGYNLQFAFSSAVRVAKYINVNFL